MPGFRKLNGFQFHVSEELLKLRIVHQADVAPLGRTHQFRIGQSEIVPDVFQRFPAPHKPAHLFLRLLNLTFLSGPERLPGRPGLFSECFSKGIVFSDQPVFRSLLPGFLPDKRFQPFGRSRFIFFCQAVHCLSFRSFEFFSHRRHIIGCNHFFIILKKFLRLRFPFGFQSAPVKNCINHVVAGLEAVLIRKHIRPHRAFFRY